LEATLREAIAKIGPIEKLTVELTNVPRAWSLRIVQDAPLKVRRRVYHQWERRLRKALDPDDYGVHCSDTEVLILGRKG
jgi:hypothetical protein